MLDTCHPLTTIRHGNPQVYGVSRTSVAKKAPTKHTGSPGVYRMFRPKILRADYLNQKADPAETCRTTLFPERQGARNKEDAGLRSGNPMLLVWALQISAGPERRQRRIRKVPWPRVAVRVCARMGPWVKTETFFLLSRRFARSVPLVPHFRGSQRQSMRTADGRRANRQRYE